MGQESNFNTSHMNILEKGGVVETNGSSREINRLQNNFSMKKITYFILRGWNYLITNNLQSSNMCFALVAV